MYIVSDNICLCSVSIHMCVWNLVVIRGREDRQKDGIE